MSLTFLNAAVKLYLEVGNDQCIIMCNFASFKVIERSVGGGGANKENKIPTPYPAPPPPPSPMFLRSQESPVWIALSPGKYNRQFHIRGIGSSCVNAKPFYDNDNFVKEPLFLTVYSI